jgi:hypothetical protein
MAEERKNRGAETDNVRFELTEARLAQSPETLIHLPHATALFNGLDMLLEPFNLHLRLVDIYVKLRVPNPAEKGSAVG